MFRRLVPLAAAIVLVLGCKKTIESNIVDEGPPADSNPTYVLKAREEQQGDKLEVTITNVGTTEFGGGGGKAMKIEENATAEYTETVLEMPAGASQPTKLTRAYKKATWFEFTTKAPKALSYEGKTVTIEKKGAGYEFTVEGKPITGFDSIALAEEFGRGEKKQGKLQDLLPKGAVKVGEPWTVDAAAVKGFLSGLQFAFDEGKSKSTGKLTRAYTRDGKQWGTIALDFDLVIDPKPIKGKEDSEATGTVKLSATLDVAIDGSSPDGTAKMTMKMDATGKDRGKDAKMTAEVTRTKTVKSVK